MQTGGRRSRSRSRRVHHGGNVFDDIGKAAKYLYNKIPGPVKSIVEKVGPTLVTKALGGRRRRKSRSRSKMGGRKRSASRHRSKSKKGGRKRRSRKRK